MARNYASWGWAGSNYAEHIYLEVWHSGTNVAGNYSTFGYNVWNNSNNSFGNTGDINWKIRDPWNGSRVSGSRGETATTSKYQVKDYASGTFTINHNDDGTMPDIYFELVISRTRGNTQSAVVGVTVKDIPRIPRASSISSISGNAIGSVITVNIARATTSFVHKVWYRMTTAQPWVLVTENAGTNAIFTIPLSVLSYLPNSITGQLEIAIQTVSGVTYIGGEERKTHSMTAPSNIEPTFTSLTHSENIANVKTLVGEYVQNMTRLNLAINGAAGTYGSTIRSYLITVSGHSVNSASGTSGVLSGSGSQTIVATVTDSRGRTATKSATINVIPYEPPKIESAFFARSEANREINPLGTYALVGFKGTVSELKVGTTIKNKLTYAIKSKQNGHSSYTTKKTLTAPGTTVTTSDLLSMYQADYSYDFILEVSDIFQTVSIVGILAMGVLLMQWAKDSLSIGTMLPGTQYNVYIGAKGLNSLGPIIDKNGNEVLGARDYIIDCGSNSNGTWEKWASGTLIQKKTVALASGASTEWVPNSHYKYIVGSNWVFPIPFLNRQIVLTGSLEDYAGVIMHDNLQFNVANGVFVLRPAPWSIATSISLRAEGRWK